MRARGIPSTANAVRMEAVNTASARASALRPSGCAHRPQGHSTTAARFRLFARASMTVRIGPVTGSATRNSSTADTAIASDATAPSGVFQKVRRLTAGRPGTR